MCFRRGVGDLARLEITALEHDPLELRQVEGGELVPVPQFAQYDVVLVGAQERVGLVSEACSVDADRDIPSARPGLAIREVLLRGLPVHARSLLK